MMELWDTNKSGKLIFGVTGKEFRGVNWNSLTVVPSCNSSALRRKNEGSSSSEGKNIFHFQLFLTWEPSDWKEWKEMCVSETKLEPCSGEREKNPLVITWFLVTCLFIIVCSLRTVLSHSWEHLIYLIVTLGKRPFFSYYSFPSDSPSLSRT